MQLERPEQERESVRIQTADDVRLRRPRRKLFELFPKCDEVSTWDATQEHGERRVALLIGGDTDGETCMARCPSEVNQLIECEERINQELVAMVLLIGGKDLWKRGH